MLSGDRVGGVLPVIRCRLPDETSHLASSPYNTLFWILIVILLCKYSGVISHENAV